MLAGTLNNLNTYGGTDEVADLKRRTVLEGSNAPDTAPAESGSRGLGAHSTAGDAMSGC